ncbi:three-Cys-motif partner protein TcmP [Paremcibacter congregatus]|uniref:Three-Cys-motif partner protein TcmP n=1 Tax=Paremcibacter congregatus TaxID=2043170 RepID=A0A2G4YUF4_9PROT|nr:three-Cys-motif partner protein TcmP [Paremcibacter congregatus]PHZ85897.1 hypothetical protein CRD36_04265 [Paremcibacter congregatus]QDE26862.1 three-Cys-motif partner protein TcmP [Paremcibacter congregatus]
MVEHRYGGDWTEIKITLLKSYMTAYTRALSGKNHFDLVYIDAFAGTGERVASVEDPMNLTQNGKIKYDGSVKVALNMIPQFQELYFIEKDQAKIENLQKIKQENQNRNITILKGDANYHVKKTCQNIKWNRKRGLLFLDPYGMEVEFETLKAIAATKRIDVCYLFPLAGVFRQAAGKISNIEPYKEGVLTKVLGTNDWKNLYKPSRQTSLFDSEISLERERGADVFDNMIYSRLNEVFSYVSSPVKLPKKGVPFFSFYYAISNPSPAAIALAKRIITHIVKNC